MGRPTAPDDYYAVLQVDPRAHPEVIRAAYRTLLRVLGKHPDLGGDEGEARAIIEAYATLSDPARRRAYDARREERGRDPAPPAGLPPEVRDWIRAVLPEYELASGAPFARNFDLVLEAPLPFVSRLYVKSYPVIAREHWPTLFILCRAVGIARQGVVPSADAVLLAAPRVEDLAGLLAESVRHSTPTAWHRMVIAIATLGPLRIHTGPVPLPGVLRRLVTALATGVEFLHGDDLAGPARHA